MTKPKLKHSLWFSPGIYQFEFSKDKIAISRWDQIPTSTAQWVVVKGSGRFRFVGTSITDVAVVRKHE